MASLHTFYFWEPCIYMEISYFHGVLLSIQFFWDVTACLQASVSGLCEGEVSMHGQGTLVQQQRVISQ
jgi:hypothetical protein